MNDTSLHSFIEHVAGDEHFRIQDDLGHGYVRLRAAEAQRRQAQQDIRSFEDVVLEMLRNARDAHAHAIFVATWTEAGYRHLTMIDDGSGIPAAMHETVFEPFVTSKLDSFHADRWGVHGRGMALYSIRQNVEDAHIVASAPGLGSVFSVTNKTASLGEKRDQSTLPRITKNDEGVYVLKGPHNIVRTVMEFALDEHKKRLVYLGSPAEIVATLYQVGVSAAAQLSQVFQSYTEQTPYLQRFAFAGDAVELGELAHSCALPLSTRTAHRILKGEIQPLKPHTSMLILPSSKGASHEHQESSPESSSSARTQQKSCPVRFDTEDQECFSRAVSQAYASLAQAYYLNTDVVPQISTRGTELIIRIPLESE